MLLTEAILSCLIIKLDQWRLMHIGAQPVPPSLIKRWKEYFPNHQYDTNYGLSESTGPGCVHLGVENIDKSGQSAFRVTDGNVRLLMK